MPGLDEVQRLTELRLFEVLRARWTCCEARSRLASPVWMRRVEVHYAAIEEWGTDRRRMLGRLIRGKYIWLEYDMVCPLLLNYIPVGCTVVLSHKSSHVDSA